jgi:hypothetical protein
MITTPYTLRAGQGWWDLRFEGRSAVLRDSRGLQLAALLLARPGAEPLHGAVLLSRLRQAEDPPLQRSLACDRWEAARSVWTRLRHLEQVLQDEQASPPERREAEAEHALLLSQRDQWEAPVRDNALRAVDAVRKALHRLVRSLEQAQDSQARPQDTLRAFGAHLRRYLLLPSGRGWNASPRGGGYAPGCFVYDPPPGVTWEIR